MTVDDGSTDLSQVEIGHVLTSTDKAEVESARMVLQAHENLVEIDESNRTKFQDVISFLKNQVDRKS